MTKINADDKKITEELNLPKGKFLVAVGRRKSAVAAVRYFKKGSGQIIVNQQKLNDYFDANNVALIRQPLKTTEFFKDADIIIKVNGGGKRGQAEAIRHGISRLLVQVDENLKPSLRSKGFLTRDARIKERKKPGLKKARRAPQWAKR